MTGGRQQTWQPNHSLHLWGCLRATGLLPASGSTSGGLEGPPQALGHETLPQTHSQTFPAMGHWRFGETFWEEEGVLGRTALRCCPLPALTFSIVSFAFPSPPPHV